MKVCSPLSRSQELEHDYQIQINVIPRSPHFFCWGGGRVLTAEQGIQLAYSKPQPLSRIWYEVIFLQTNL